MRLVIALTLIAVVQTAADDLLKYIILFFREKLKLDISCESFARQMIHIKCEALFSLKRN